jgi:hypothetical protein
VLETVKLDITLNSNYQTHPPKARILLDGKEIFRQHITESTTVLYQDKLTAGTDHQLAIELRHKLPEHTVIDEQGKIIEDSVLLIDSLSIEDVDITEQLSTNQKLFYYEHSGGRHTLYNTLGVNGKAIINFSSPIYVWMLENIS